MKNTFLILAIISIAAVLIFLIFSPSEKTSPQDNSQVQQNNPQETEQNSNPQNNPQAQESNPPQTSDGGDDSSGGAEGGTENPQTTTCSLVQIAYALKNLEVNQTCNSFQDNDCIDKTVICDLEVENLDSTTSGNFNLNFNFIDKNRNTLTSAQQSEILSPQEIKTFQVQKQFTSPQAQIEISCAFNTIEVPKKEVC